ncbi:MAG: 30S ribosomal protein S20 [Phycisphaerales bacterium]|nr:30S ribosomal protein S20 [Phycisphaerales bacterium]
MAHSLSAQKRVRQNEKERARNKWRMIRMREAIKAYLEKIAHGTATEAQEAFSAAASVIDKSASKGIIHKNQASRRKSRLHAKLKTKQKA